MTTQIICDHCEKPVARSPLKLTSGQFMATDELRTVFDFCSLQCVANWATKKVEHESYLRSVPVAEFKKAFIDRPSSSMSDPWTTPGEAAHD